MPISRKTLRSLVPHLTEPEVLALLITLNRPALLAFHAEFGIVECVCPLSQVQDEDDTWSPAPCTCAASTQAPPPIPLSAQVLLLRLLDDGRGFDSHTYDPPAPAVPVHAMTTLTKAELLAERLENGVGLWHQDDKLQRDTLHDHLKRIGNIRLRNGQKQPGQMVLEQKGPDKGAA